MTRTTLAAARALACALAVAACGGSSDSNAGSGGPVGPPDLGLDASSDASKPETSTGLDAGPPAPCDAPACFACHCAAGPTLFVRDCDPRGLWACTHACEDAGSTLVASSSTTSPSCPAPDAG